MLVNRWQAPTSPKKEQVFQMFDNEGLRYSEEKLDPGVEIKNCRIPQDEVRAVVQGELILNVSGNKILLRSGDRILIPSNTIYSKAVNGKKPCVCIYAHKLF